MDASGWDERYASAELEWGAEPNRFLVPEVEGLEPGRALDLAAGEGRNAIWLAERDWSVTAVDYSHVGIDKGRRRAAEMGVDLEWAIADVLTYEPSGRFDLVIVFYLHLPPAEMKVVFQKAAAALQPGGTLLVVGHDRSNLTEGVGGPQDPTRLHDAAEIATEFEGFVIEKAERVLRPVEGTDRRAIDTLVRARRP